MKKPLALLSIDCSLIQLRLNDQFMPRSQILETLCERHVYSFACAFSQTAGRRRLRDGEGRIFFFSSGSLLRAEHLHFFPDSGGERGGGLWIWPQHTSKRVSNFFKMSERHINLLFLTRLLSAEAQIKKHLSKSGKADILFKEQWRKRELPNSHSSSLICPHLLVNW